MSHAVQTGPARMCIEPKTPVTPSPDVVGFIAHQVTNAPPGSPERVTAMDVLICTLFLLDDKCAFEALYLTLGRLGLAADGD